MFTKIVGPRDVNGNRREFIIGQKGMDEIRVTAREFRRLAVLCAVPLNAEDAEVVENGEEE